MVLSYWRLYFIHSVLKYQRCFSTSTNYLEKISCISMSIDTINTKLKNCSACKMPFTCGDTTESSCWCNQYPAIFNPDPLVDCLCQECLHKATVEKIDKYVSSLSPQEARTNNKAKDLSETCPPIPNIDYYIENGLFVFTAWSHLKRGTCCNSGCRHCPYK